ncbi:hypothetical protein [Paenarthrobacter ureafaciens]|uniref:hypothetical protein n=1 Tax=Paenarthrobacter ureafaciens TaxID=37931 RepID=UPI00111A64CC|nr:hypothetical protein [Paenarthrobacter ureafaciens]
MTNLLISTSPRSTLITAPDADTAAAIRSILTGSCWEVHRDGIVDPLTLDVGIGVEAMEAGDRLIGAGYRFNWHPRQHPLNRRGAAWGIPVESDA